MSFQLFDGCGSKWEKERAFGRNVEVINSVLQQNSDFNFHEFAECDVGRQKMC